MGRSRPTIRRITGVPDVLELARFRVAADQEEEFLASRPAFLAEAIENFEGLKSVHLARLDDGSYVDVAIWETREQCQIGMETSMNYPAVAKFLSYVSEDLGMETGEVIDGATRPEGVAA